MKQYLNTTLRNIAWFKQTHELEQLDMKPDFQRNQVWTKKQQSYLIDTILKGYPIPEIYMQELITEDGETKYLVVDGKQRITAILEFLEGRFSLNKEDSPEWAGKKFADLELKHKKFFYEYNFVIRLLPEMCDDELRSIFQRLNRNVASLNKQELRQATYWGEFITLINDIANRSQWIELDVFSSNDIRRMLDAEYISELAVAMLHGLQNKKETLDDFYRVYEENFPEKEQVSREFDDLLEIIMKIIPDIRKTRWNKKTDFYTLFLVLHDYLEIIHSKDIDYELIGAKLIKFGAGVDSLVSTVETAEEGLNEQIITYARNVRASSDLKSRVKRHEALKNYLDEFLG